MPPRCKEPKYIKKRPDKPVVRVKKPQTRPDSISSATQFVFDGEGDPGEELILEENTQPRKSPLELLRDWVEKQRFIPQDLSDDFLTLFLSAAGFIVQDAAEQIHKYFYSRQEPSPLFTNRDPLHPENEKILKKLYVLPLADTTDDGLKVILTGLVQSTVNYDQIEHAKILAMVLDLLIWERDIGFGDYVIVFDGRGFQCPQLLENRVRDQKSITNLLQDTIPGLLRSFYLFRPPEYIRNVATLRNGMWFTVVDEEKELIKYLPSSILPREFGGAQGNLGDLLEKWDLHLFQNRKFFVEFERRMANDYRRRLCHEKEVAEGGKNWIHKMKLVADEWEYKIKYYERMRTMKPMTHPAYGSERRRNMPKPKPTVDPFQKCRELAKEEEEEVMRAPSKTKTTPQEPAKCRQFWNVMLSFQFI